MAKIELFCRTITPFKDNLEIDEAGLVTLLHRLIDTKTGIKLAASIGEGYTLTPEEHRKIYEIAVREAKGKVPVYANPSEQHTAKETLEQSILALEAGCDAVNIYPPAGLHGYKATEDEQIAFFDLIIPHLKGNVMLAANPVIGYVPSPKAMGMVINKYPNVIGLNINADDGPFLMAVQDVVKRDNVKYKMEIRGFLNGYTLGATGMISHYSNVVPKTFRQMLDACEKGDFAAMRPLFAGVLRYKKLVDRWAPGNARPTKMVMKLLKLPGGPLREPNRMPADDQFPILAKGLKEVGLKEIDELCHAAGVY